MRVCLRFVALALVAITCGCAAPITLPRDFVTLAAYPEFPDFRAVTGDDARVWMRRFTDPNEADLEFWIAALEHDFGQRGYDIVGRGEVQDAGGADGRWFECITNVQGDRIGYLVAVWVDGREVTVAEFAARSEVFAARVEVVRQAMSTVNR